MSTDPTQRRDGHGSPSDDREVQRRKDLSKTYAAYHDPSYSRRWASDNRGNSAIVAELVHAIRDLTDGWMPGRTGITLLDLGCGHSSLLGPELEARIGLRVGVDLLLERVVEARERSVASPLLCADGGHLPLRSGSVDMVAVFTMMSSVLDEGVRRRIGAEIHRVLAPGGAVLWYDMRVPNPRNPGTTALRRSAVEQLFPTLEPTWQSITVLPPIARHLGRATRRLYPWLARVPMLRSHRLGLLVKVPAP